MTFSPGKRRALAAMAEALLADEDDAGALVPPAAATVERVVASVDDWIGSTSATLPFGFSVLILVVELLLPLFVVGRLSRMSRLPLAERIAYLERLEGMNVGLIATTLVALKLPLLMVAYEEGDELALTGFDRPTISARRSLPVLPRGGG